MVIEGRKGSASQVFKNLSRNITVYNMGEGKRNECEDKVCFHQVPG
jgi:hypothetical protein